MRESQLRAIRPAFEPANFGQIAGLKAGSEIELRDIRAKFAESDRVLAMQFWQKHRRRPADFPAIITLAPLNEALS